MKNGIKEIDYVKRVYAKMICYFDVFILQKYNLINYIFHLRKYVGKVNVMMKTDRFNKKS